jgi:prevent-host-death family protein
MRIVNVHAAKTHFSRLLDAAAAGEDIVIAKGGKPVAKLVPLTASDGPGRRRLGALAGRAVIPPDFDAPLPEDVLDQFAGR